MLESGQASHAFQALMRLQPYFHSWLRVEPYHFKEMILLGQKVQLYGAPRRLPIKGGAKVHEAKIQKGDPVWVGVITGGSNQARGKDLDYLVVFVDHKDHNLKPKYEYIVWLDEIRIIERHP